MGSLGMLLIYRLNQTGHATEVLGVLFVADDDMRRVCWFGPPIALDAPVEFVGATTETPDGVRLGLVDVAPSVSPVTPALCGGHP